MLIDEWNLFVVSCQLSFVLYHSSSTGNQQLSTDNCRRSNNTINVTNGTGYDMHRYDRKHIMCKDLH
jgi:hypothetical protein